MKGQKEVALIRAILDDRKDLFGDLIAPHVTPLLRTLRATFGNQAVPAARILVAQTDGRSLVEIRDELGREIARLKEQFPDPPEEGVLVRLTGRGQG